MFTSKQDLEASKDIFNIYQSSLNSWYDDEMNEGILRGKPRELKHIPFNEFVKELDNDNQIVGLGKKKKKCIVKKVMEVIKLM